VVVDHALTVFLVELSTLRREHVENRFGGAAKAHSLGSHDKRPIDQDRMRIDRVKQHVVGKRRVSNSSLTRIGLVKPKASMLLAICFICARE